MKAKYFWIKERYNPQIGIYYVPLGNISIKQAKKYENPIYGDNYMHKFKSESVYKDRLDWLRQKGETVHD